MVRYCKFCGNPIKSNNKHRKSCYKCKVKYPYIAAPRKKRPDEYAGAPFNRKDLIAADVKYD